jgi:hypothetical protein
MIQPLGGGLSPAAPPVVYRQTGAAGNYALLATALSYHARRVSLIRTREQFQAFPICAIQTLREKEPTY